ncbi:MAG: gliding motility-associated C-terminal domain-containing protein [Chitinophagales bacterium]
MNTRAQTVAAPILNCVTNVSITGNIFVRLTWTIPVNTCGPFNAYYIYRSTSFNGPFTLVYTENNQAASSYDDNVGISSIVYYYYMVSDFTCPGAAVLHSDTLDNSDPEPPLINYVTVKNNVAEISWQPGNSPETYGYILYQVVGGINIPIDTIYGKNNTTYTDVNAAVNTDSVSYTLATIDSCLNTGPINVLPQHTIFLKQKIDRCNNTVTLDWYQYNHWDPIVLQYDVYVAVNGGLSNLIQTFPSNVLSYQVTGLNDGDFICFTVVATQTTTLITSTSNELCATLNVVQSANDLYIRNVTVAAPGHVAVYYSVDPLADLLSLKIERSLDSTGFTTLDDIPVPANLSMVNIFSDTTALTSQLSYYYRIIASDSCGGMDTSSIGKSILLSGYAFSDLSFLLKWDASYLEHGSVAGYDVNRDDGSGFNSITVFDKTVFEYAETGVPSVTPCYFVEAIDSMIFPNGVTDTVHSRSNVLCLNQPSQIYMPNAFAPQGNNNIFKPILNVEGVTAFTFSIYNRWGKEIFTSLDQDFGWDGRDNGDLVQQGAYAYQVVVIDGNRKRIEAKGTVLVVR